MELVAKYLEMSNIEIIFLTETNLEEEYALFLEGYHIQDTFTNRRQGGVSLIYRKHSQWKLENVEILVWRCIGIYTLTSGYK